MMRAAVLALLLHGSAAASGNMNGKYSVASAGKSDVPFNDDYASKGHEYFDVWAPEIATHYGEVFWTDQHNQPIPDAIVKRFAGKVMAITGYEQDQVMVSPTGQPGVNPSEDVSVPINWAYNHHYMAWMTGSHSKLEKVPADPSDPMAHGAHSKWISEDLPSAAERADPSMPTSQMFSEGNGGESRKSFHGYPNGYAQLIESPTTWHITPMQIDTRNRDCGATPASIHNCSRFVPGPEPKQARYGRGIPKGTNYSGVLECPCNSRYGGDPIFYPDSKTKILTHSYETLATGKCAFGQGVSTADDCFAAAQGLGIKATSFANRTVSNASLPEGCSFVQEKDGSATVYFNPEGKADCLSGTLRTGTSTPAVGVSLQLQLDSSKLFLRSKPGLYCSASNNVLKAFPAAKDTDRYFVDSYKARDACEAYCLKDEKCWGCSVGCEGADASNFPYGRLANACQWSAIDSCGERLSWPGRIWGDVSEKNPDGGLVTMTMTGPADVWFGVGLNATAMADSPYTLLANASGIIEQKIGTCGSEAEHCPGDQLATSVKVLSDTAAGGVRTVVMTRGFRGLTKNHYSFGVDASKDQTIPLIAAVGSSPVFAYHKAHDVSKVTLTAVGEPTCVCDMGASGSLCEAGGTGCAQFTKNCVAPPAGSLLEQKNPTCNSRQYAGGLNCCHHGRIMLDQDQEIRPELLRYHMKFRFWFQEYKADAGGKVSHYNLPRVYQQTEANAGEYDIPPAFVRPGERIVGYPNWPENTPTPGTTCTGTCPDGPDCECIHTITYTWKVSNLRLIYMGGHCHAPACVSIELYRNDTGELLCRQLPKYGKGNFPADKYDEAGYLALPPCLAGPEEEGLSPSVWLPANTPLYSVKKNINTHTGHFGEMASWQMRGVNFPLPPAEALLV